MSSANIGSWGSTLCAVQIKRMSSSRSTHIHTLNQASAASLTAADLFAPMKTERVDPVQVHHTCAAAAV